MINLTIIPTKDFQYKGEAPNVLGLRLRPRLRLRLDV